MGALPEYRRDPLSLFYGQAIAYGGSVRIRVAHEQIHLLVDPEHIRQVLTVNTDKYVKGISYASLSHLLGDGLLTSDGELWRRQRALIRPAFGRQHTVDEIPLIVECGNRLLDRLDAKANRGEVFDLVPELMSFALDVVCRAAMGSDMTTCCRRSRGTLRRESAGSCATWHPWCSCRRRFPPWPTCAFSGCGPGCARLSTA